MFYRETFDVKISASDFTAVFDFSQDLAIGETISSASVTATVYSGTDATPSTILSGTPVAAGKEVDQLIINGVEGVTYRLLCAATTSLGQVLTREGFLVISPAAA